MKFFIDTADTNEIRAALELGLVDGVTTNPSLVAKTGRDFHEVLHEIAALVDGPISAEVVATESAAMVAEAKVLHAIEPQRIVIKLPLTADGLKATMLQLNGLVEDFTFAAKLKGEAEPLSTLFYLPPVPNVTYSAALMSKAEEMLLTEKAPYPPERTMLTSGLTEAGLQSLTLGKRLETPYLAKVRYEPPHESQFVRS